MNFKLDNRGWEHAGEGRIARTLSINGTLHHLEGYEVKITDNGLQEGIGEAKEWFSDLHAAFGGDGAMETININGKAYTLFLSPFCK